jgi:hypothetical protein
MCTGGSHTHSGSTYGEAGEESTSFQTFWRQVFWIAVVILIVTVLRHVCPLFELNVSDFLLLN